MKVEPVERRKEKRKETNKVRPKAIPILTKEQFSVVSREMKRKPSTEDLQRIERVKELLKNNQF